DDGLGDALRVVIGAAGKAGVDQEGLAGGADDERGGSAFDIDPIDVESALTGLGSALARTRLAIDTRM
ncbi:MAG: hypothetical protein ABI995_14020, partial [Acidobacteriota bacterium]